MPCIELVLLWCHHSQTSCSWDLQFYASSLNTIFLHRFSVSITVQKIGNNQAIPWELKELIFDTASSHWTEVRIVIACAPHCQFLGFNTICGSLYVFIAKYFFLILNKDIALLTNWYSWGWWWRSWVTLLFHSIFLLKIMEKFFILLLTRNKNYSSSYCQE